MYLICIAKPGVDLERTLFESETSRHVLRFYHPKDMKWGVRIEVATVSSALSLLSELRWYAMRFMSATLIEDPEHGVYLTRTLAQEVYEDRVCALTSPWKYAFRVAVLEDGSIAEFMMGEDTPAGTQVSFVVWGVAAEYPETA